LEDFSYDNSLINLSYGEGKLSRTVVENTWSVDNITEILVISASEYESGKIIHDRTSKVQSLDADGVNINEDKEIFDVTFDKELSNNDIVSMYILQSDDDGNNINIFLCDNGTFCNESNYGSVSFNGDEGWYNITITGLSESKNVFNIDPSKNTKFDYIKVTRKDTTTYTSTNISYPITASIETKEISIASLSSFLQFHKNDLINDQNIDYSYSTDSGNSWESIPTNDNLSDISISSGKIRIKADLSGDGIGTPIIYDFAVSYLTQICNENWNATYGVCTSDNTILKYYIDKNECGTADNLPVDNGTYEICVYDDIQNETISIQNKTKFIFDERQESDVLLELITAGIANTSVSIVEYSTNSKNSTPSFTELGKYIDIIADNATKQNLTSINIKIYYTDEEIANANLDEETIKIHYFNETSSRWQELNSTVNTTGNYVEVTIDHMSTFGIFGEEIKTEESSSSQQDESSGSDAEVIVPKISESEKTKVEILPATMDEVEELKETSEIVDVSVPDSVDFEEKGKVEEDQSETLSIKQEETLNILVFLVIFLFLTVILAIIYLKFFRKKNRELTQEQLDKIEEMLKKTEEKYSKDKE